MTTQHTPDPWLPSEGLTGFPILYSDPETGTLETLPETVPNALLCASAPDLLAALEDLCNVATHPEASRADLLAMVEEARAAIAKARGTA